MKLVKRRRQEDCRFKTTLGNLVRLCVKLKYERLGPCQWWRRLSPAHRRPWGQSSPAGKNISDLWTDRWVEQIGASRLAAAVPAGCCVPKGLGPGSQSQRCQVKDRVQGYRFIGPFPCYKLLALGISAICPAQALGWQNVWGQRCPDLSSLGFLCALAEARKVHKL